MSLAPIETYGVKPTITRDTSTHVVTTTQPGDIIFTGTPAGVGKIYPGDKIEASIENVGKLTFSLT